MNFIQKASQALTTFIVDKIDYKNIVAAYHKGKASSRGVNWKRQIQNPSAKEIKDWKMALMAATDPENPRRGELMRFYQGLMTDLHLQACIENRILPVQCAPFKLVDADNNEDTDAKKLLERPWYMEAVKLVTNHTFEGTKLLEMFELTESGELKEVTEIPQSNFIPSKGIILYDEDDTDGTSYKEGIYRDYYIQIGGDYNLGMLNMVAVIVIAKKLGLGSWMSYIERFGVPPLFAITNRMDDARLEELFEMMENFRMNHFAVLQGEEKIDIPQGYNVDAHQTFNALIERGNSEISKYINGGTGTTDEKSFVGSAEVHERLLKLRNNVDKLMFKFYFNQEIKPRLVKLSPVYAPLEKLTFEWDESENMSVKEIINAITSLSPYYEFDISELERLTGLPFTDLKQFGMTMPMRKEEEDDDVKKKSKAHLDPIVSAALLPIHSAISQGMEKEVERIAKEIYQGKRKAIELDQELVIMTYTSFSKTAKQSYGGGYYKDQVPSKMRQHLLEFSGSKAYRFLSDIEGQKQGSSSEQDFIEKAKKEASKQFGTWQVTEDRNVARSAQTAKEWKDFIRDKDIFPNLKYRTMLDSEVREAHAANEGIVKRIEDWDATPPFDYNCRCWLEQTDEPVTTRRDLVDINPDFNTNPGKSGEVFSKEHSYFKDSKPVKDEIRAKYEGFKELAPINHTIKVGDNNIFVSDFVDYNDLKENLIAARKIALYLKEDVTIRPYIKTNGIANPDYQFRGELGDLKTFNKSSNTLSGFIRNSIDSGNFQRAKNVVMDITLCKETGSKAQESAIRRIRGMLIHPERKKEVQSLFFIKGDKVIEVTRKQVMENDFMQLQEII